jgi:hypothetical protein
MLTQEQKQKLLNAGYSTTKIQAYENYLGGVKQPKSDFRQDVSETVGAVQSSVENRADEFAQIERAQERGEIGGFRSMLQKFGQGVGAATDVIGETIKGVAKSVLSPSQEQAAKRAVTSVAQPALEVTGIQNILEKYEELKATNPNAARDIATAANTVLLGLDLAGFGGAGSATRRGAAEVADIAGRGSRVVADVGTDVGRGAVRLAGAGTSEIGGALTGTSAETLQEAFRAASKGGKTLDSFTKSLRSQITPEEIVNNLTDSLGSLEAARTQRYSQGIQEIGGIAVPTTGLVNNFTNKLKDFGITIKGNQLDFTKSKFSTVPSAQNKIQQAYDELARLGNDANIQRIDTSRQALRNLELAGEDNAARSANSLINEAADILKQAGNRADSRYGEMLGRFSEDIGFTQELRKSLSANDTNTIDATYRKLATALRTNNEQRMALIRELDEIGDGTLLATIAGQQLSEALPRGIFKQIAAGIAGAGVVTGGLTAGLVPALVFASPRVVGEVIRALGIASSKAEVIIKSINDARKVLISSGAIKE